MSLETLLAALEKAAGTPGTFRVPGDVPANPLQTVVGTSGTSGTDVVGYDQAEAALAALAREHRIDWPAARSQMIDGDAEAGAAQLAADEGDGIELAGVLMWLRLLAGRARPAEDLPHNGPGPGLDSYGRPLPKAREQVTSETCTHFIPDAINPEAGVGQCRAGVGEMSVGVSLHPMALRLCGSHEARS